MKKLGDLKEFNKCKRLEGLTGIYKDLKGYIESFKGFKVIHRYLRGF